MRMKASITLLQILLVFYQAITASTIEKGIIYGVQDPSSLSNLPNIPQNNNGLNYRTYYFKGNIKSIAADSQRKVVFIATSFQIQAVHNYSLLKSDSYVFSTEFHGKSDDTGEIAFDYLSKNLFWCDSRLNWVVMKPAYNGNTSFYKVVVQDNLNRPEGLALDPEDGIMFFSDNYPNGRIRKASLNGENSTVIVFNGLVHVTSLSIDTENNNLYWTDVVRSTVEVCDYNGFNRRVINRSNMRPMSGIQFYKNVLHLVSEKIRLVRGVDALSGVYSYDVNFYPGIPKALTILDTENPPNTPDPCYIIECEHICVNTPSGPTCLCHEAYDLYEDGISCIERPLMYKTGIVISTHNEFEIVNIASINNISTASQNFKDSTANITSFAVDAVKAKIYYIDKNNDVLKQMDLKTLQISVLTNIQNGKDLMLDWKRQLLGWINEDYSEIISFGLESGNTTSVYSKLGYAKSLTINPIEGKFYWISGSPPLIMSGNWDGKSPLSLVTSEELTFPKALNYDVTNNRLYWSEGLLIKSCLSNGLDIQTHNLALEAADVLSYKEFFVWILNQYLYFGLKNIKTYQNPIPIKDNATGVAVFDPYLQKNLKGTCQIYNGGCEGICVPQQEGRRCECDLGLQLQNDSQTCSRNVFESNFVLVTDCTHDRILQVSLDTGELNKIPINATGAAGITFDKSTLTIFFTSSKYLFSSKVMSVSLHGQWKIKTYATGFQYSESVAIDYSTGNIYFAAVSFPSQGPDSIRVLNQETLEQKTLITSIFEPRSIALYSSKGLMFWTELKTQRIGKAHMDGTSIQYIVTVRVNTFWPNGVAIDFTDQRLYWIDGFPDTIKSSDLNGGDQKLIAVDSFSHMRSISVHGNYVYYTGFKRQRVLKIHKTTGARVPFMEKYPELGVLCDVFVSMENDTVDVHPLCAENNGLCSTFCLPTPAGRTCGCPDNVKLLSDQKTCEGVPVCPSLFSHLQLLNCPPYLGKSCEFECNPGFRKVTNSSVRCNALGQWEPDVDTLCIDMVCPVFETNAVLKPDCTRKVGMSCGFLCNHNYIAAYSDDIVCGEDGTWDQPVDTLCTNTNTQEALNMLIVGLSTGLGVFALITIIGCVYCLYLRKKQNQTSERVQKIQEVSTVELTNIGMETNEFPDGKGQRPLSEGYSSLYEESDYGYSWLDDAFDPIHILNSSIGGNMILGEYIDPASEEENMMGSDGIQSDVLTSEISHNNERMNNK